MLLLIYRFLFLATFTFPCFFYGQNLVPNSSFELGGTTSCQYGNSKGIADNFDAIISPCGSPIYLRTGKTDENLTQVYFPYEPQENSAIKIYETEEETEQDIYSPSFGGEWGGVYPNPSNQTFYLESQEVFDKNEILVFDIMGRKAEPQISVISENKAALSFANYPTGIYLLKLKDQYVKLVLEK